MKTLILPLAICLLATAADNKIAGGPYVVNVTSKTATIAWLVSDEDVTLLPSSAAPAKKSPAFHVAKTTLTGLTPNTRYDYEIPGAPGGTASFKTAPAAGPTPFTFVAYGDNRTRPEVHQRVVNAMIAHGIPDMLLQSGDLVADGDDSSLWTTFSISKRICCARPRSSPPSAITNTTAASSMTSFKKKRATIPSIGATPTSR
jgi:hypothetical protein